MQAPSARRRMLVSSPAWFSCFWYMVAPVGWGYSSASKVAVNARMPDVLTVDELLKTKPQASVPGYELYRLEMAMVDGLILETATDGVMRLAALYTTAPTLA